MQSVVKTETLTRTVTSTYRDRNFETNNNCYGKEMVKVINWFITSLVGVALLLIGLGIGILIKLRTSK
jgi:hypothetical protein